MNNVPLVGLHIIPTAKSLHHGQSGVVVADYGSHLLVKVDDELYSGASRSSGRDGKYIQVSSVLYKIIKDNN